MAMRTIFPSILPCPKIQKRKTPFPITPNAISINQQNKHVERNKSTNNKAIRSAGLSYGPLPLVGLGPLTLQGIQLPPVPGTITARKLPIVPLHPPANVDQPPLDGGRDGRPVGPHAVLELVRPVQIEQEEGHDVGDARLHDGALAPGLEGAKGLGGARGVGLRGVGVRGEARDGGDLIVEVGLEVCAKLVHDAEEFGWIEGLRVGLD